MMCGFCGCLLMAATPACGQGTQNILKNLAKGFRINLQEATESVPHAAVQMGQIEKAAGMAIPNATVPVIETGKLNATVTRFVNKHKNALFKAQTSFGISPRRAATNLHKMGAQPTRRPPFPKVETQKGFIVDDFSAIGYNSGDLPQTPFFPHPHYMYRGLGLALDGVAVRNILENGLQVKDVGPDHNTRRLAYASHMGRGALQAIARQPVINLSNSPTVAIYYAKRYQAKGMLVLVVVKEKNNHKKIITTPEDISAQDIQALAAVLSIDGKPTWCQIELTADGFLITPYAPLTDSTAN